MKYKNVLMTGCCGFIGSHVFEFFVKKYPNTFFINIDKLDYCSSTKFMSDNIIKNCTNFKFIKGNLKSRDLIHLILNDYNIDAVIHFAAQSHVDNSFENSIVFTQDNILATHCLLECCRKYGKIERFIHVSTDEVYGESIHGDHKNKYSLLKPTNPYAATKAGAELIAYSYYRSYNLPIIVTRGNNVFGERQYPEKLIPKFIKLLLNNKKCTIQGDGTNKRSFVYINDVVHAYDVIMNYGKIGEIYNIGSDDEYNINDIAYILIEKIIGLTQIDKWIEFIKDRDFNDCRYLINSYSLKKLGWKINHIFEESIDKTVLWYKNNSDYWQSDK